MKKISIFCALILTISYITSYAGEEVNTSTVLPDVAKSTGKQIYGTPSYESNGLFIDIKSNQDHGKSRELSIIPIKENTQKEYEVESVK